MAITIRSAGAWQTGTSVTTTTPVFGATTAAGNLLIVELAASGAGDANPAFSTTASGWSFVPIELVSAAVAIAYKPNCGANETPPTFTWGGGTTPTIIWSRAIEVAGAALSSPLDQTSTQRSLTLNNPAPDAAAGEIGVAVVQTDCTKTATCTFADSWGPAGGTVLQAAGTGGVKTTGWCWSSHYVTSTNSSQQQDSITATPSTGSTTNFSGVLATFKLPGPSAVTRPVVVSQAISRASNW